VDFYDEVLRELLLALGAALFLGNAYALAKRRSDARSSARSTANAKRRGDFASDADLQQAPVARSVTYMLIGLVIAAWALASIISH
jgi:hypothetical protein